MGFFEDAVVKAKEIIDITGQKVEDVVDTQKIKINIAKQRSELSKDYELLGKLYYNSVKHDNVDAEAFKAIVEEIDTALDNIREYEAELAFAKGGTVCDDCGAVNSAEAEFCNKCGKQL